MQYPATPNEETISALESLLANPGPTNGENSQELEHALASAGLLEKVDADHLELWLGGNAGPDNRTTMATMPRTYEILFPRDLAREYGKPGISLPVSAILRWAAAGRDEEDAAYYLVVAEALEEMACTAPNIEPQWRDQVDQVRTLAELDSLIADAEVELSDHVRGNVGRKIRDAVREVMDDCYRHDVEIMMPVDALPDWIGEDNRFGFGMPVGRVLSHLAADLEEVDRNLASRLKCVVEKYYPDDTIQIEVNLPDETVFLVEIDSQRSRSVPWQAVRRVRPLPGSVSLRHYEEGSAYSANDNEHPFKLVRCWLGDVDDEEENWEEGCLLFSDDLIMHARIERHKEN